MIEGAIPPLHESEAQLARILQSPEFKKGRESRDVLEHVVKATLEGRTKDLTEQEIGKACVGRKRDWNPATDNIVRVHISKLRKRLSAYYRATGQEDPLLLEILSTGGGYIGKFTYRSGVAVYPHLSEAERTVLAHLKGAMLYRSLLGDSIATTMVWALSALSTNIAITAVLRAFVGVTRIDFPQAQATYEEVIHNLNGLRDHGYTDQLGLWHTSFVEAVVKAGRDRQYEAALPIFNRALEESRGESLFFWWHTATLAALGRFDEAIALLQPYVQRSEVLAIHADLAVLCLLSGRCEQARSLLVSAYEMAGDRGTSHILNTAAAMVNDALGQWANGLWLMDSIDTCRNNYNSLSYGYPPYFAAKNGNIQGAQDRYAMLLKQKTYPGSFMPALQLAIAAVGLGKTDDALNWLEISVEEYDPYLLWINLLPCFRELRSDPRFADLVRRLHLARP